MENTNILKSNLKFALTEWHEFKLPEVLPRTGAEGLPGNSRIVSVIGPRRAGKSWTCFGWMKRLLQSGVPRRNIVYVNFEDERFFPYTGRELTLLLETQEELYEPESGNPRYFFIDEVHNVPNWSKWVRRVTDQNQDVTVIVTGSSSRLLSTEIATELRGRAKVVTIFPYSFEEFLRARSLNIDDPDALLKSPKKSGILRHFNEYLVRGGFPDVCPNPDYQQVLQQYYRTMFSRDIVERFGVKHIRLFEDFLKIIMSRFAALASVSNIEKDLLSLGHRFSKNTLITYLGYAEDAFLLFTVPKFDNKVTRQLRNPKKAYVVDHGLANAVRFSSSDDRGRLLENAVFMTLRREYDNIYYHTDNTECDFVIQEGRKITGAYQVTWALDNEKVYEREVNGLISALKAYKLKEGYIITRDDFQDIKKDGFRIKVWPLWYFSLKAVNGWKT
ncbi:MAG: ATP-binding protein [Smithella sp.]|nr:ATP-binding protein [Smithella sp.]